jgi:hypothetical protein
MKQPRLTSTLALLSLVGLGALAVTAQAAPNYYGNVSSHQQASRLTVTAPKAGQLIPGATIVVTWTKTTKDVEGNAWLYTATETGVRKDKVEYIRPTAAEQAAINATGGSVAYTLPKQLPNGRYVIVVSSGLDVATSEAFVVMEDNSVKMSDARLEAEGTVKKVEVHSLGATGTVLIDRGGNTASYSWGSGSCPAIGGGVPGALSVLAAMGNVKLRPRVREATRKGVVEQICLDGISIDSPPPQVQPLLPAAQ